MPVANSPLPVDRWENRVRSKESVYNKQEWSASMKFRLRLLPNVVTSPISTLLLVSDSPRTQAGCRRPNKTQSPHCLGFASRKGPHHNVDVAHDASRVNAA